MQSPSDPNVVHTQGSPSACPREESWFAMNTSVNNNTDHAMGEAHLSPELRALVRAMEQERAQLSEAALRRIIAGTVPLVSEPVEPVLRVVGPAPVTRVRGGMGAMRLAASIALAAGAGFAILAQRSGQTPTTMAQARVSERALERGLEERAVAAQALAPGDDDVLLWESWLAAADVSRSEAWTDEASEADGDVDDGLDWLELSASPVLGGSVDEEAL
jgi:hypothetical protein